MWQDMLGKRQTDLPDDALNDIFEKAMSKTCWTKSWCYQSRSCLREWSKFRKLSRRLLQPMRKMREQSGQQTEMTNLEDYEALKRANKFGKVALATAVSIAGLARRFTLANLHDLGRRPTSESDWGIHSTMRRACRALRSSGQDVQGVLDESLMEDTCTRLASSVGDLLAHLLEWLKAIFNVAVGRCGRRNLQTQDSSKNSPICK
ncbi:hypothetical protein BC567DRAFT_205137 [Phyllosticta citribraziliensis]